ncbi:MAG: hypothetical protein KC713_10705, partial [Candidatus Omnitrophica bacterium]|nr:hypothetical protein [Candidatus Omnitrophota bacterium]
HALQKATNKQIRKVVAVYVPTEKNLPCLEFFKRSGMTQLDKTFCWEARGQYAGPKFVKIIEDNPLRKGSVPSC